MSQKISIVKKDQLFFAIYGSPTVLFILLFFNLPLDVKASIHKLTADKMYSLKDILDEEERRREFSETEK